MYASDDLLRVPPVPGVLGQAHLLHGGLPGERGQRGSVGHGRSSVRHGHRHRESRPGPAGIEKRLTVHYCGRMIDVEDYLAWDGLEMAARVRRGEVIGRRAGGDLPGTLIERLDPVVNAVGDLADPVSARRAGRRLRGRPVRRQGAAGRARPALRRWDRACWRPIRPGSRRPTCGACSAPACGSCARPPARSSACSGSTESALRGATHNPWRAGSLGRRVLRRRRGRGRRGHRPARPRQRRRWFHPDPGRHDRAVRLQAVEPALRPGRPGGGRARRARRGPLREPNGARQRRPARADRAAGPGRPVRAGGRGVRTRRRGRCGSRPSAPACAAGTPIRPSGTRSSERRRCARSSATGSWSSNRSRSTARPSRTPSSPPRP